MRWTKEESLVKAVVSLVFAIEPSRIVICIGLVSASFLSVQNECLTFFLCSKQNYPPSA